MTEPRNQNIEFGLATPKDAVEMVNFHNSYYGENRKPEYWLWEYFTNKPEDSIVAYARDGGQLIATQCMIPIYMDIQGERIQTGKSENTLLMQQYRGAGIMERLYEYAVTKCIEREMPFLWGFTSAIRAFEKFGFTSFPGIATMIRQGNLFVGISLRLRKKAPFWVKLGSVGKLILRYFFTRHPLPKIEKRSDYVIREGPCDERALHSLYQRLKQKHNHVISIKLDQKYLNWRIRKHPFLSYSEYQVYQGSELRAYAFVTLLEGAVSISDLTSEDNYATSILLLSILKYYNKKARYYHMLYNPKDCLAQDLFSELHRFGFRVNIGSTMVVLRDLTGTKKENISNAENWHINGLWSEGYSM